MPSLPEELNEIFNQLMSRSRSQRYQSGAELALALRLFLDRYKPGYRAQPLRPLHARNSSRQEIERELRLLEEYVIEGADPSKVGENLIADALGDDAPYTKFTAATAATPGPVIFPRVDKPQPTDLARPKTRILTRNQGLSKNARQPSSQATVAPKKCRPIYDCSTLLQPVPPESTGPVLPERPPLHQLSTQILDRNALYEAHTQLKSRPDLHVLSTQILNRGERKPLSELQTKILVREPERRPRPESAARPAPERYEQAPPGDARPPSLLLDEDGTGATTNHAPERAGRNPHQNVIVQDLDGAGREESTTGTTLPIGDEDLEPGSDH